MHRKLQGMDILSCRPRIKKKRVESGIYNGRRNICDEGWSDLYQHNSGADS